MLITEWTHKKVHITKNNNLKIYELIKNIQYSYKKISATKLYKLSSVTFLLPILKHLY